MSTAMVVAAGTSSRSIQVASRSSRIATLMIPVTLPPGRARLVTRPSPTGSSAAREDDGNRCRRCLGRQRRIAAARRNDHGHLTANEIGRECRESIVLTLRPSIFNHNILPLDDTRFSQASAERSNHWSTRRVTRC